MNKKRVSKLLSFMIAFVSFSLILAALCPAETARSQKRATTLKEISIPVVHVKGNHYEAGYQLGTKLKENFVRRVERLKKREDWEKYIAEARLFLQYSKKYVPEYVTEVKGAAEAAGLELDELFSTLCEEIGDRAYEYTAGCSDLIASNDVTEDGSVLVAHNNDTSVSSQEYVTIIHYEVEGEPEIIAVGYGGLGISVGYNSAGISLTGNQVNSNDMRVGVPRMLLVRKILAAERIGEAIDAAILKHRASNYNQVITDQNGEIYSIEGSATEYEPIYATDGYLVHTNHYVSPWMRRFEYNPIRITCSLVRYNRGRRLLKNNLGEITVDKLKQFLSDHVNYPDSICRHGERIKTTFSIIINLNTLTMWLARGNPCEVKYNQYQLFSEK
ncbi:MAG: C45 family autoproteolytic acyltransferase/hydrolase [Candidatus Aminicenantes bacterium]